MKVDDLICKRTGCGNLASGCGGFALDCDGEHLFCACGNEWPLPDGMQSEEAWPEVLRLFAVDRARAFVAEAALEKVRHDLDVARAGCDLRDGWLGRMADALEDAAAEWDRCGMAFSRTDERRQWCRDQAAKARRAAALAPGRKR